RRGVGRSTGARAPAGRARRATGERQRGLGAGGLRRRAERGRSRRGGRRRRCPRCAARAHARVARPPPAVRPRGRLSHAGRRRPRDRGFHAVSVWLLVDPHLWHQTLVYAAPLIIAALGELIIERSGVLNIGIEGMMLVAAVTCFVVTWQTKSAAA